MNLTRQPISFSSWLILTKSPVLNFQSLKLNQLKPSMNGVKLGKRLLLYIPTLSHTKNTFKHCWLIHETSATWHDKITTGLNMTSNSVLKGKPPSALGPPSDTTSTYCTAHTNKKCPWTIFANTMTTPASLQQTAIRYKKATASNSIQNHNAANTTTTANTNINAQHAMQDTQSMNHATPTNSATSTRHNKALQAHTPPHHTLRPNNANNDQHTAHDDLPLPTPINVQALESCLQGYDPQLKNFLVEGFREGFDIGHDSAVTNTMPPNSESINRSQKDAAKKLQKEIQFGRIAGPFDKPPFPIFHISPLALREKKTPGEYRLLHNLSHPYDTTSINGQIPDDHRHVKYATVGHAISKMLSLPKGSFAAKTDIANAFRLIPIKPKHYHKLGMKFQGAFYFDKVLPQGLASSCRIFEIFSTAVHWILETRIPNILCVHYLDDFLIIAPTKQECHSHLTALLKLFEELGIPVAEEKATEPSTNVVFLGIELDTTNFCARLPPTNYKTTDQLSWDTPRKIK